MQFDKSMLREGDCLLYFSKRSVVDWAIAVKTYTRIAHIEIYDGINSSLASRNGIGVGRYPLRLDGLVCVRRPVALFDMSAAREWFDTVRGQGYDWKGLLCFYLAVKQGSPSKMFCSEMALRLYRAGCVEPFNADVDADRTPPSLFWVTPEFKTVWQKDTKI